MSSDRGLLKRAITGLLDVVAKERPLGRFLTTHGGAFVEIEKNEGSPPNLWCLEAAAGKVLISELRPSHSYRGDLRTKRGKHGNLLYGRQSALEHMPQLGEADLVYFAPESLQAVGKIIDRLLTVAPADFA